MLKNIPPILSPALLKLLDEMGHGDELVLGDANFPAAALGQRLVRADGHGIPELLDAILTFFPLDSFVECPVGLMDTGDVNVRPPIWQEYSKCILRREGDRHVEMLERFAFYERTKTAYAVVATGETELYANIILKKGVVVADN
ncbi:MAG: fucose isomerase [Oscillospiraceae bacterium]|jgi:L-fucose mutarotase|nr:fucose isomerase [Oscillospiraceae bacterium]